MSDLWWFYTIILGGAFGSIAASIAVQWKTRLVSGGSLHWPTLLWQIFLLILTVQVWIAVGYYQKSVHETSILGLLAFLWVPLGILILSIFLADQWWNGDGGHPDDHRFGRLRRAFFSVLFLIPVVNLVHEAFLGSLGWDADTFFPVAIAVGAVVGLFIRSHRADTVLAAVMTAVIAVYLVGYYGSVAVI